MIADSCLFIAHFRGDAAACRFIDATLDLVIPFVVAAELHTGALLANKPEREQNRVSGLLSRFPILWPDDETLNWFARVRTELRRAGKPIGVHDVWIAALAFQHNLPIASRDSDFERLAGLDVVTWK